MSRIGDLRKVHSLQGSNGNWNYDPYMHGMYNGLELALAIMENKEPNYREAPKEWLVDIPMPDTEPLGGGCKI